MRTLDQFQSMTANEMAQTDGGALIDALLGIPYMLPGILSNTIQGALNNTVTGAVAYTLGVTADALNNLLSGIGD